MSLSVSLPFRKSDTVEEEGGSSDHLRSVVLPGDSVSGAPGVLRGHGTLLSQSSGSADQSVSSSALGTVSFLHALVSVKPLHGRYFPSVGDVIVGRVVSVLGSKWMFDIRANVDASLSLASSHVTPFVVTSDGASSSAPVQLQSESIRRRTEADARHMRTVYSEGDVVVSEVQAVSSSGEISLQTRSSKFGKLQYGTLVRSRPSLIVRSPHHMLHIGGDVSIVLGMNGYVWIQPALHILAEQKDAEATDDSEQVGSFVSFENRPEGFSKRVPFSVRQRVARVANCVRVLTLLEMPISTGSINRVLANSESLDLNVRDMLLRGNVIDLVGNIEDVGE
nr:exosome complex component rrp4 [Andalucia godoyi]|eukprot:ANDGO_04120.mRNA.1 Exosome complex component rrp4